MTTLLIDRRGAALDADAGRVVIRVKGERTGTVPLRPLERVIVGPTATISTRLMAAFWRNGTALVFLSGSKQLPDVRVAGKSVQEHRLRLAQFSLLADEARRAALSHRMIGAKLKGQHATLLHIRGSFGSTSALKRSINHIEQRRAKLEANQAIERSVLRGIEGSAASSYFAALASTLDPGLNFQGRNRRPPKDPFNAALSLSYTLMHSDAIRAAACRGFDPMMGFYHDLLPGREALACDIAEPARPRIDLWLWQRFAGGRMTKGDFSSENKGCRLVKAARRAFFADYEADADVWRQSLSAIVERLAHDLTAQDQKPLLVETAAAES